MMLWILLAGLTVMAIAVVVQLILAATGTEAFTATSTIRGPPYDAAEKIRIFGMATTENAAVLRAKAEAETPANPDTAARELAVKERAGGYLVPVISDFFTQKFTPATAPITVVDVADFMDARRIAAGPPMSDIFSAEVSGLNAYFVDQQGTTTTETPAAGPGGPGAGTVAGPQNPLFGPPFTSLDEGPSPSSSGDSSAFTSYPQVFGGVAGATSVAGPAVRNAAASLPTAESAGASEQAQFFPFSRSPGDMEVIPDPFRVSQTFSASNYSSKTDPVPFLADFSAFQS